MGLISDLFGRKPEKFTKRWYESRSDEELDREREKVRQDYCNPELDDDYRASLYFTLKSFDGEMSRRAWEGKEPGHPAHSEHGWYLPSDD